MIVQANEEILTTDDVRNAAKKLEEKTRVRRKEMREPREDNSTPKPKETEEGLEVTWSSHDVWERMIKKSEK